jgi:tetratricopeptide (TPR) repeat protein
VSAKAPPAKKKPAPSGRAAAPSAPRAAAPDPLSPDNVKKLALRLGLPVLVGWGIVLFIDGWIAKAVMGVITLALAGAAAWAINYAKKSKAVVDILKTADTPEGRKEALQRLESEFKKDDAAALFAKAQLQMQEDPREALKTLEQINLDRVLATVADEARAQRAMLHLVLGETDEARVLVDPIDLSRHQDAKSRATLTAIIAEAWSRTGQAKRAVELLDKLNDDDPAFAELRPQIYRSRAFAYAWAGDTKQMRKVLLALRGLNVQYLTGFITKKKNPQGVAPRGVHPLLEKEAFDLVMKSGAIPRRMEVRRG